MLGKCSKTNILAHPIVSKFFLNPRHMLSKCFFIHYLISHSNPRGQIIVLYSFFVYVAPKIQGS